MRRREDGRALDDPPLRRHGHSLGPAHGLVGNVLALRQRLAAARERPLERESAGALAARAVVEDGLANWANHAEGPISSGARELLASSSRRPTTSTRSCSWRRRARLAGGAARRREGLRHLPRHGRQRLRAAEDVRAHGRRALARPSAAFRGPRARAGGAARGDARAEALFAMDWRRRSRALRCRLPGRPRPLPDPRHMGVSDRELEFRPMVPDDLRAAARVARAPARHVAGGAITGRTRASWPTTCLRSRGAIPPITTSSYSKAGPIGMVQTYLVADYPEHAALMGISDCGNGRRRHPHRRGGAHRTRASARRSCAGSSTTSCSRGRDDVTCIADPDARESRVTSRVREGGLPRRAGRSSTRRTGRRAQSSGETARAPRARRGRRRGRPAPSARGSAGSADGARPRPARRS